MNPSFFFFVSLGTATVEILGIKMDHMFNLMLVIDLAAAVATYLLRSLELT